MCIGSPVKVCILRPRNCWPANSCRWPQVRLMYSQHFLHVVGTKSVDLLLSGILFLQNVLPLRPGMQRMAFASASFSCFSVSWLWSSFRWVVLNRMRLGQRRQFSLKARRHYHKCRHNPKDSVAYMFISSKCCYYVIAGHSESPGSPSSKIKAFQSLNIFKSWA